MKNQIPNRLTELANLHNTDKGYYNGIGHNFAEIYDNCLSSYREVYMNILEIGVWDGGSLRMWADYFPNANIHGVDLEDKTQYNSDRIKCSIVDQSSVESLEAFTSMHAEGYYDLIIDDGSHHMRDQQITLAYLLPLLKSGGIYILEDVQTSECENNTILYGRPIIIESDKRNTTLAFLEKKPYSSVYLSDKENEYIQSVIDSIDIYRIPHNNGGPWGPNSITSIIIKK
jgi:hypothetical protein